MPVYCAVYRTVCIVFISARVCQIVLTDSIFYLQSLKSLFLNLVHSERE